METLAEQRAFAKSWYSAHTKLDSCSQYLLMEFRAVFADYVHAMVSKFTALYATNAYLILA